MDFRERLGDRIRDLRTDKGLTQDELADLIEKRKNHVSNYEQGRNAPQPHTLVAIAAALETTTDYLLTGASPSKSRRVARAANHGDFGSELNTYAEHLPVDSEPFFDERRGPSNFLVPVRAQAGLGQIVPNQLAEKLESIYIPGIEKPAYTFEVEGDSMEPLVFEGDWVVCTKVEEWSDLRPRSIYAVITRSSGVYLKLFRALSASSFVFYSANTKYEDTRLDHDDVREVWEAVARLSYHVQADGMPSNELKQIQAMQDFLKQKFPDFSAD